MKKRNINGYQYKASIEDSDTCADPEGGQGSGPSLKNHTNIGFSTNIGPGPLKITKLRSQHSMPSHHRYASEMPFKWGFASGPIMARL